MQCDHNDWEDFLVYRKSEYCNYFRTCAYFNSLI